MSTSIKLPDTPGSQPICLTIETNSTMLFGEPEPEVYTVDLFDAVNRAFDFDKMQQPGVQIESPYIKQGLTYKRICRDLAINPTQYIIGFIQAILLKGDFPVYGSSKGLLFKVYHSNILGIIYSNGFYADVKSTQVQKNVVQCERTFILREDTVITIENMPANSKILLFLYPEKILTLDQKSFSEKTYKLPFKKDEE